MIFNLRAQFWPTAVALAANGIVFVYVVCGKRLRPFSPHSGGTHEN